MPSSSGGDEQTFQQHACAADGPPPLFAILLVGNFRTFYDPRVYKSIRANLIDALGAPSVVFIHGKMDAEHVRGAKRDHPEDRVDDAGPSYSPTRRRVSEMTRAAAHLSAHGGPEVIMEVANSSHSRPLLNERCAWLSFMTDARQRAHWEEGYSGQLQAHALGYGMMAAHETRT